MKTLPNVLINVPDLTIIGGKSNYYSALKGKFEGPVTYFTYGSRGKGSKEGKLSFVVRMLSDYLGFVKTILKEKVSIVHLNPSLEFNGFFRDAIFFIIAKYLLRRKVIVFWRGWSKEFEKDVTGKYAWLMKQSFLKADSSIVLAKEFEQKLVEWGYTNHIFLETTVLDEFLIEELDEVKLKERYATASTQLLFLARLERNKGIFEILEIYEKLKAELPELSLTIAGDGSAMQEVKALIESRNLNDINLLGYVRSDSKRNALVTSHIYLFPSWHGEGLPNSLLEAMGCGMPVITTANAGIKDFFEDGKMGCILNDCTSQELESKLRHLLFDRTLQTQIALYNHRYAKDRFRANKVVARLESIYGVVEQTNNG